MELLRKIGGCEERKVNMQIYAALQKRINASDPITGLQDLERDLKEIEERVNEQFSLRDVRITNTPIPNGISPTEEKKKPFTIPTKEVNYGKSFESQILKWRDADQLNIASTLPALRPAVEEYLRDTNFATTMKQVSLVQEANKEKALFINRLNDIYGTIMLAIERSLGEGRALDYTYETKDYEKMKAPMHAAFRCVQKELRDKGWVPRVCVESVVSSDEPQWRMNISCFFQ